MKYLTVAILATATAVTLSTVVPATAEGGWKRWDRLEDRIDRRENRIDERVTFGPRDRLEDILDRAEDRLDRRGIEGQYWFDRHERRSWWRIWGRH